MLNIDVRCLNELQGVSTVAQWQPPEVYERRPPARLHAPTPAGKAHAKIFGQIQARLPAQHLHALGEAMVSGPGIILKGDSVVKENTEGAPMERILGRLRQQRPTPAQVIEEPVIYTMRYGLNNYGHCLTDIVPRMIWAALLQPRFRVAVLPGFVPTAIEALESLGLDSARLMLLGNEPVLLKQGYFPDVCNRHPLLHSPAALKLLRQVDAAPEPVAAVLPRRLFVTRGDAQSRHLRNHRAVARALAAHGYVEVEMGKLRQAEQRRLFASASEIVGIAGAAMTNLLYCQAGTRVTLLSPDSMPSVYFWDLASQMDLDFRIGYFAAHRPADGNLSDFKPDPEIVLDLARA